MPEKKRLFTTSLSFKILFAVVSLILLFGSVAALAVYNISKQDLVSIHTKNQVNLTRDKAKDVEIIIGEVFVVLKQISGEHILSEALSASTSPTLVKQANDVLKQYLIKDLYSTIYVMGTDGITLLSTDPTFIGKNYSFRPYFFQALKGQEYVDIGLGITTNKLGYYFSKPIYKGDAIVGVLIIKTTPTLIEKVANYDLLTTNSQTIITDDKGIILYSSKPNRLYNSLGHISPAVIIQEQEHRFPGKTFAPLDYDEVLTEILQNKTSGSFTIQDEKDKKNEILTFVKSGPYPFYFIIEADSDPYVAAAAYSAIIISLLVFITAAIASLVIAFIIRSTLSPIDKLVEAADEIGKGNLSYQVPSFSSNELATLAESFKKMSVNLQDLYKNLEEKVIERTMQLEEQNKQLEESKAAFKDALDTSERANKLMVGRELEMLELKKVIKTLKEVRS